MMEECKPLALVHDVEEGEISDSASSVEEISEEAFIKGPQPPASAVAAVSAPPLAHFNYNSSNEKDNSSMQKVWTMRDLYKYQLSSNYSGNGLYNLAWASAVQNKPLDDVLEMEYPNSSLKRDGAASGTPVSSNVEGEAEEGKVDEEREDGELEEGEIDFDSPVMVTGEDLKEDEQQAVVVIKKGLESVTMEEAVKSLDEVCSRMHNLLDSVQELPDQDLLTAKHDIAALAFSAMEMVNTVFCSMNRVQKIFHKDMMLRLLAHASNLTCGLFSGQQLNEIEAMICDLDSLYISLGCEDSYSDEEVKELDTEDATGVDSNSVEISDHPPSQTSAQEDIKLDNSKWRGSSLPLLDLHKDHDADSLPSPTRGGPPFVPSEKGLSVGYGLLKPEWPVPRVVIDSRRDSAPMHPYETDAVKAVSSYQQKFGRSSFFMHDRLPSPTPSDDGDAGDDDISGEISSSSNMNVNLVKTSLPCLSSSSSPPKMEITSGHAVTSAWNDPHSSNGPNPPLKTSSARSRDPRLRLAHSDVSVANGALPVVNREPKSEPVGSMISSRKQKNVEDLVFDGPAFKRQRFDEVVTSSQGMTGTGGWLEDRVIASAGLSNKSPDLRSTGSDPRRRPEFAATGVTSGGSLGKITVDSNAHIPATTSSAAANLHSLLKEITDNPSKFMDKFKMEQQKSANLFQMATQPIVSNPSTGAFASAGALQTNPQVSTVERMKPRDPRRFLHSGTVPKGGNMELNQSLVKTSAPGTPGILATMNSQRQDGLLDNKSTASRSVPPPNIAGQLTQSLKNIADIVSVSQATVSEPVTSHIASSAPVQAQEGRTGVVTTSGLGTLQNVPVRDGKVSSVSSQSQNDWREVQHLFDGFDDRQKAAIHKERARRLAEQKKMFAGRKLCLVLDLDHTLLNSAKYAEVDPVDDEKLRQKEEQEREKLHRHLFRFPHMAMWTKLRPGIWNFLERVSKLFELHLYTMGNKLYATEMAKLLDPKGELFAGRVISRGDDTDLLDGDERVPKIKDLEGVMGMESSVLIIDDSVRVWPHHKLNLIAVERYIYFPCSRRQFGLPGPSLLEIDHDERPEDGTLASCLGVIERIHETFFTHKSLDEADVRNILASEQRKILAGCRVCFSRIIPVAEANPHLHPLWQTAEQFGAVCTNTIDDKVTHVVANSGGTDKVHWARNNNRFVVYPGWIEASALLYRRANEVDFTIKL